MLCSCLPTFHENCSRGQGLGTAKSYETMIGGKQGHPPLKYFHSNKSSFCVSQIFLRSRDCHNIGVNLATHRTSGDMTGLKTVVYVCLTLLYSLLNTLSATIYPCSRSSTALQELHFMTSPLTIKITTHYNTLSPLNRHHKSI